jgi:hypothetical protein
MRATPGHTDASSRKRLAGRFFCLWDSEGASLAFLAEWYSHRWAVFRSALESQPEDMLCSRVGWASILRKICLIVAFLSLRPWARGWDQLRSGVTMCVDGIMILWVLGGSSWLEVN